MPITISAKLEETFEVQVRDGQLKTAYNKFTSEQDISISSQLDGLKQAISQLPDGDYTLTFILEKQKT